MAKLVSKTYGDALFELALESGNMEALFDEAKALLPVVRKNKDLTKMMNHPKIVKEEKQKIIEDIFRGRVSKEMIGLMTILAYFIDRVKEYKKIGTATVTSAMELSLAQRDAIRRKLLETTDYVQFEMNYKVDASLIGGVVIRVGDRVVDGSVKNRLTRLASELSKTKLQVS